MPETPGRAEEAGRGALARLGDLAYYRTVPLLLVALVVIGVAGLAAGSVFDLVKPFGFADPASESARGSERFEETTGVEATPSVVLLVQSRDSNRVRAISRRLAQVDGVARVINGSDAGVRAVVSSDGGSALVVGYLAADASDPADAGLRVEAALSNEPDVLLGGIAVASAQINRHTETELQHAELLALPILLLLSFWIFRGAVAAILPIGVASLAIVIALAILSAIAEVVDVDALAINLVTALGLGLAIDYSLFVISRFREELAEHGPGPQALIRTMETAGRTVAFSSLTIAGALAALLVFPQRYLYSMGIGGATVALLAGVVVLTVLPALLTALGPRINSLAPLALQRDRPNEGRTWYSLARFVIRRPLPVATAVAGVMLVIGLPFLRVDLTQADARALPEGISSRTVDSALDTQFEADPGDSTIVLVEQRGKGAKTRFGGAMAEAQQSRSVVAEDVSAVRQGPLTQVNLPLAVDPNSDAAARLVEETRRLDWGGVTFVLGRTAELVDQRASINEHLPLAVALIVALTFLLLLVMTRSILLPFQALLMNLLTVSVALGAVVLIFQDGRFEDLLGYTSDGAIDRSVPILLFAIVFGLSTDYGIFVVTRVQEERWAGASDADAIALGIKRSGQIVTASALLLSVAIGAVVLSDLVYNKELAIGSAAGILVDATLVRGLLFPAVMRLGGRWTWWTPAWLGGSDPLPRTSRPSRSRFRRGSARGRARVARRQRRRR